MQGRTLPNPLAVHPYSVAVLSIESLGITFETWTVRLRPFRGCYMIPQICSSLKHIRAIYSWLRSILKPLHSRRYWYCLFLIMADILESIENHLEPLQSWKVVIRSIIPHSMDVCGFYGSSKNKHTKQVPFQQKTSWKHFRVLGSLSFEAMRGCLLTEDTEILRPSSGSMKLHPCLSIHLWIDRHRVQMKW